MRRRGEYQSLVCYDYTHSVCHLLSIVDKFPVFSTCFYFQGVIVGKYHLTFVSLKTMREWTLEEGKRTQEENDEMAACSVDTEYLFMSTHR